MKLHVFHLFLLIFHPWMITSPHCYEYLDNLDPTPESFVDESESFVTYADSYLSRSVDIKHFDTFSVRISADPRQSFESVLFLSLHGSNE